MNLLCCQNRVRKINRELEVLASKSSVLYAERKQLEETVHVQCKHKKVIYTDGHVNHDPDDYDTPEVRICLGCGLTERSERTRYANFWDHQWGGYKTLTAAPIRRFCVPGRTMSDTVNYYADMIDRQVKYARERGEIISWHQRDYMLEEELSKYWEHVKDRVFKFSYPARIKAVQRIGYPA